MDFNSSGAIFNLFGKCWTDLAGGDSSTRWWLGQALTPQAGWSRQQSMDPP
jgi:hypothetical protein